VHGNSLSVSFEESIGKDLKFATIADLWAGRMGVDFLDTGDSLHLSSPLCEVSGIIDEYTLQYTDAAEPECLVLWGLDMILRPGYEVVEKERSQP